MVVSIGCRGLRGWFSRLTGLCQLCLLSFPKILSCLRFLVVVPPRFSNGLCYFCKISAMCGAYLVKTHTCACCHRLDLLFCGCSHECLDILWSSRTSAAT